MPFTLQLRDYPLRSKPAARNRWAVARPSRVQPASTPTKLALERLSALPTLGVAGLVHARRRRDLVLYDHSRHLRRRQDALVRLPAARSRQRRLWLAARAQPREPAQG